MIGQFSIYLFHLFTHKLVYCSRFHKEHIIKPFVVHDYLFQYLKKQAPVAGRTAVVVLPFTLTC